MPAAPVQPADTTMMGVVHDALRRDLRRLHIVLSATPPADDQRRAIAKHSLWMMDFLHHHHRTEDDGLWPLVRARRPELAGLFDRMQADHACVLPAVDDVSGAAARYRDDGSQKIRATLLDAVTALENVLLPHLDAEEQEAMPAVSASISDAEWNAWDKSNNVRGKSLAQLAREGHWLMDGLDPVRYQVLVHLVPAPVRFVIIRGFAGRYRTACARRWGAEVTVGPLA